MRMVDIIDKKKKRNSLSTEEINFVVSGYMSGDVPDYQMSAFLMAVYFCGMNNAETAALTFALANSGEIADLSPIQGIKVDKHSSGGVGDKVTLIVMPLCAAIGLPVAKMSGRSLGYTGGTIDKLESIRGFRTNLSKSEFMENVNRYKMAIAEQTSNLVPADKKIYALRDATSTVDSMPLIASSIMSKKIAAGADCIVLDVKVGSGAFMKNIADATKLANMMIQIGRDNGKKTIAVITNMNEPLGREIGNANEIREVIDTLRGYGSSDVVAIAVTIASHMAILGGIFADFETALLNIKNVLVSGAALEKFRQLVEIQGGDVSVVDNPEKLPKANYNVEVISASDGYIVAMDTEKIGMCAMLLGAGRKTKEDSSIDFAAGISMIHKIGDFVRKGETVCIMHTNSGDYQNVAKMLIDAFKFGAVKPAQICYVNDVLM